MFAPGILVFERTHWWEAALKRYFAPPQVDDARRGAPPRQTALRPTGGARPANVWIRPGRVPADLAEKYADVPGSLVVVDAGAGAELLLALLAARGELHPEPDFVVLLPPSPPETEWALRELGATTILPRTVTEERLGDACLRLLRRRRTHVEKGGTV